MLAIDHHENGQPMPNGISAQQLAAGGPWPFKNTELDDHLDLARAPTQRLVESGQRFIYELHPNGLGTGWATGSPGLGHALQHVGPGVLAATRAGRALIAINASWEAHDLDAISPALARSIGLAGIPAAGVVTLTSNLAAAGGVPDWPGSLHAACFFENFMRRAINRTPAGFATLERQLMRCARPRTFLCFNRRAHAHRQVLLSLLERAGIMERGLVSMPAPAPGDLAWRPIPGMLAPPPGALEALLARVPMVVDTEDFAPNHARTHPPGPYLQTWFSLVTETLFHVEGGRREFLSEKIFKPIANHHPFLVAGLPGTLEVLRGLGYRTFAPFIDERYDLEQDPLRRLHMLVEETTRLAGLGDAVLEGWFREIAPDLEHNRRILQGSDALGAFAGELAGFLGRGVARRR